MSDSSSHHTNLLYYQVPAFTNSLSFSEPIPAEEGDEKGKGEELEGMVRVSDFPLDLRELLPSIKVWSDWMLGQPEQWNPPPCSME